MGQGRKLPSHLRVEHLRRQFSKRNRTRHPREFLGRDCFPSFEGSNVDSNGPSSAHSPTSSNVIIVILRVFDDNERGADRHLVLRRDMSLREAKSMIAVEASIPPKYLFLCIQLPDRAVELRRDDASLGDLGIPNNATLMATSMASEGTTMAAVTTDEECEQTSSNESVDPVNLSPEHRSTDQSDASQGCSSAGDKSGGVKGDDSISSRQDDLFQVFVRTPYGNTTTLSVNQSTTVADLKRQLSSSTTITPSNGMRLCYGGKPLSDSLTLFEYGITRDSTLEMHDGGLKGGSWDEDECPGSPGIDELVAEISRRGAEMSRRDAEMSRQEAVISHQEAVIYRQEGEISRQEGEIDRLRASRQRRTARIRNLRQEVESAGVALNESEESRRELEERSSSDTGEIATLQESVVAQQEELVSSRNFLSTFSREFRELRESNSSLTANAATLRHTVDYQQRLLSSLGEVRSENDGLSADLVTARETIDAHRLQIAEMEGVMAVSEETNSALRSEITTLQQQVEVAVGQVEKLNGDNTRIDAHSRGLQLSLTQSQQNLEIVMELNEHYEQENAILQERLSRSTAEIAQQQSDFNEFANQAVMEAESLRAENALLQEQLAEQAVNVTLSVADVTLREQLDEANVSLAQRDQTIADREAEIQQLREQIQQYETMAQSRDRVDSTSVTPAPSRRGDGGDSSLAPSLPSSSTATTSSSDSANDTDSDPLSPSASDTASSSPVGETSSESPSLSLDESDMDDSNDNDERNPGAPFAGVAVDLADLNCEERALGLEQAYRDGLLGDQGEAGATSEGSVADDDGHGVASSNHNLALGRAAPSSAKSKVDTSVKSKVMEPSLHSKKKSQTAPAELSEESLPSQSKKEAAKAPSKSNEGSTQQKAQSANQSSLMSFFSSKPSGDSLPKSKSASNATSHRSKRNATMTESRNSSDSNDASNLGRDKKRRSSSAIPKQSESQPLAKALVSESSTKTRQPKRKANTSEADEWLRQFFHKHSACANLQSHVTTNYPGEQVIAYDSHIKLELPDMTNMDLMSMMNAIKNALDTGKHRLVIAQHFPSNSDRRIVDDRLLYLGNDGLPGQRSWHGPFQLLLDVLVHNYGIPELEAVSIVVGGTAAINKSPFTQKATWHSSRETTADCERSAIVTDPIVEELVQDTMELFGSNTIAIVLGAPMFGACVEGYGLSSGWINNGQVVNTSTLPHGHQIKSRLFNGNVRDYTLTVFNKAAAFLLGRKVIPITDPDRKNKILPFTIGKVKGISTVVDSTGAVRTLDGDLEIFGDTDLSLANELSEYINNNYFTGHQFRGLQDQLDTVERYGLQDTLALYECDSCDERRFTYYNARHKNCSNTSKGHFTLLVDGQEHSGPFDYYMRGFCREEGCHAAGRLMSHHKCAKSNKDQKVYNSLTHGDWFDITHRTELKIVVRKTLNGRLVRNAMVGFRKVASDMLVEFEPIWNEHLRYRDDPHTRHRWVEFVNNQENHIFFAGKWQSKTPFEPQGMKTVVGLEQHLRRNNIFNTENGGLHDGEFECCGYTYTAIPFLEPEVIESDSDLE